MLSNDWSPFWVRSQSAAIVGVRNVSEYISSVPQATADPIKHGCGRAFSCHFSFEFTEHHDNLQHGFTHRSGGVEIFPEADDLNVVLVEKPPELDKIKHASGKSI